MQVIICKNQLNKAPHDFSALYPAKKSIDKYDRCHINVVKTKMSIK